MNSFGKVAVIISIIAVLGLIGSLMPQQGTAAAGSAPVTVINTPAQPVPTAAQGTTSISGNVGITGTPSVNVGNFPVTQNVSFNGSAQPVSINSTNTTPVFVQDVDSPARHPFTKTFIGTVGCFGSGTTAFTVAGNTELVLEFITFSGVVTAGHAVEVAISPDGGSNFFEFAFNRGPAVVAGQEFLTASQPLRVYAGPGSTVQIFACDDSTSSSLLGFSSWGFSGYTVGIP